jgi:hypothetical protein
MCKPRLADQAKEAWQQFATLSKEMDKFLGQNDTDVFLDLLWQRAFFEEKIKTNQDQSFIKSPQGQTLLKEIIRVNKGILQKTHIWLNKTKTNRDASQAYESLGYTNKSFRWDQKF